MKFLFALLGVALAAQYSLLPSRPFNSGKQYYYRYDGVISSGLPVSAEGSVTRMQADIYLQFRSEQSAVMQMMNIRLAASHAPTGPTQEELPAMETLENREISSEHQKILELPVAFMYKEGLVSELQYTEEEEKAWSANIKRAVLNMLQMNQNQPEDQGREFYTALEKTIEGECEVAYSVLSEKDHTVVSKSVNFDKCTHTAEAFYGRRFAKTTEENKILVPQTLYSFKVSEEQIKEVVVRSTYSVRVMEKPVMQTQVEARLILAEITESRKDIEMPTGKRQEILYSNEWETAVEKFFKGGEKYGKNPFEGFTSKVERASEIIESMKEKTESDAEWVHFMARLVRIFRMCTSEELDTIHDKLFMNVPQNIKHVIEHSLAIAGTKNTIEHLLRHIKDKEISPLKAAQLFKSIQETHYPSDEIATMIQHFARSEVVRSEPILRQSAWLCYGAVVRGVVNHRDEKHLFEENKPELKKKYLSVLEENLEQASEVYEKVLALKTIANSGLDVAVHTLEKVIYNKKENALVRVEAIQALRILGQKMPKKIHRVLMPIFSDRKEHPEVRVAAFERLIYTLPNQMVLSQIVNIIEKDPNVHVANYCYSFLEGIGKTTFVTEKRIIHDCQLVLKRSSFRPSRNFASFYKHFSFYNQKWVSGGHINVASIFGKDSMIPKDMNIDLEGMLYGRWNMYLGQMGFSHQNFEQLLRKIYNKLSQQSPMLRGERAQKRVEEGMNYVKKIAQQMNIRIRQETTETPFAMLYLRYKEMDFAVLPIDEQILARLVEKYLRHGRVDSDLLEKMLNGNMQLDSTIAAFLFESTVRIPTTLGLPLTASAKMPTLFTTSGKVTLEKVTYGVRLGLRGKPALTSTQVYQKRIWTPLFEHGVKIVRPTKIALPIDMDVEVTLKEKVSVSIRVANPEKKHEIFEKSVQPVAFLRFPSTSDVNKYVEIEENTIVVPGWNKKVQPTEWKYEFGGNVFRFHGNGYKLWSPKEYFYGEHNYHLSVQPVRGAPKEWTMNFELAYFNDVVMEQPSLVSAEEPKIHGEDYARKLTSEISRESKKGISLELTGSIQSAERTTFRFVAKKDNSARYYRLHSDISMPIRDEKNWKWEQKIETFFPRPVQTMEELKEKEGAVYLVAMTKWGSSERNEIVTKMLMEQTAEMKNWMRPMKKESSGMEEYERLLKASVLNKVKVVSKYTLSKDSEKFFDMIFDGLRAYGWWSSKLETIEGKKNHFKADFVVEPITRQYVNLTLETPRLRLTESIWIPYRVPLVPRAQLPWSAVKQIVTSTSECGVVGNKIFTFDEVNYRAPLTKCWTVLSKDCSEEARYAVLIKKIDEEKKAIKLVKDDNEFVIELVRNKLRVTRNKKVVPEDMYLENNMELINPKLIIVDLKEVIVRFDGKTVKVQAKIDGMNGQCGLCGKYNGDKSDIFRTANDESTENLEEFHRSYLLRDEECEVEEQKLSEKKEYKVYSYDTEEKEYNSESYNEEYDLPVAPRKPIYKKEKEDSEDYDVIRKSAKKVQQMKKSQKKQDYSDEEREQDYESEDKREPKMMNKVIERSNNICFSVEPIAHCPENSRPLEETKQKVKLTCLPRHEPETRRLMKELRREPQNIDTLRGVESSKVSIELLQVPKMCLAF